MEQYSSRELGNIPSTPRIPQYRVVIEILHQLGDNFSVCIRLECEATIQLGGGGEGGGGEGGKGDACGGKY